MKDFIESCHKELNDIHTALGDKEASETFIYGIAEFLNNNINKSELTDEHKGQIVSDLITTLASNYQQELTLYRLQMDLMSGINPTQH